MKICPKSWVAFGWMNEDGFANQLDASRHGILFTPGCTA